LEISSLVYTLNCKLDGNVKAYCLDAHYLKKAMKQSVKRKTKLVLKVYANERHLPSKILSPSKCRHKPLYYSGYSRVHSAASRSVRLRLHNKEGLQKGGIDITQLRENPTGQFW
jgi:hypothetical protein